jgi:hypothetical protein
MSLDFILGVVTGALGYLIVTFWFEPILRYRDVKHTVAADLVYYANAIMAKDDAVEVPEMKKARTEANRRRAAELRACSLRLCWIYKCCWLRILGENPDEASKNLIGLANAADRDNAEHHIQNIKQYLRLPSSIGRE